MKDLFFTIWGTNGYNWIILTFCLFIFGLLLFVITFFLIFNKYKNISSWKKFLIIISTFLISYLMMYQIIPALLSLPAAYYLSETNKKSINALLVDTSLKLAIYSSIIPWQKGALYCNLGNLYSKNYRYKKSAEYYDEAYKFIKTYKYKNFIPAESAYNIVRQYDKTLEILEIHNINEYRLTSMYVLNQKYKIALERLDKQITENPTGWYAYAVKAYIYNKLGDSNLAEENYQKALLFADKYNAKNSVDKIYNDFGKYYNFGH